MLEKLWIFLGAKDIDYDEEYDENYDEEYGEEVVESYASKRETIAKPKTTIRKDDNIIPIQPNTKYKIELFKPKKVDDGKSIANAVRNEKICIISMADAESDETSQSIADYLTGAAYVLNCRLTMLDTYMFMVSPAGVDITGSFIEEMKSKKPF